MQVLFLKDHKGLGRKGEVKDVAEGFAQNHLIPKGIVKPVTGTLAHELTQKKEIAETKASKQNKVHVELKKLLEKINLSIPVSLDQNGRLYGSIRPKDIQATIEKILNVRINENSIDIQKPIKEIGEHIIGYRLSKEVVASVHLTIIPKN